MAFLLGTKHKYIHLKIWTSLGEQPHVQSIPGQNCNGAYQALQPTDTTRICTWCPSSHPDWHGASGFEQISRSIAYHWRKLHTLVLSNTTSESKLKFVLFMHVCLCVHKCTCLWEPEHCVSYPLKLELQAVVRCHVGAGNRTCVLCSSLCSLSSWAISSLFSNLLKFFVLHTSLNFWHLCCMYI